MGKQIVHWRSDYTKMNGFVNATMLQIHEYDSYTILFKIVSCNKLLHAFLSYMPLQMPLGEMEQGTNLVNKVNVCFRHWPLTSDYNWVLSYKWHEHTQLKKTFQLNTLVVFYHPTNRAEISLEASLTEGLLKRSTTFALFLIDIVPSRRTYKYLAQNTQKLGTWFPPSHIWF